MPVVEATPAPLPARADRPLRLVALWCVYLTVRNASRLPAPKDRANLLLPWRAKDDTRS